MGRIVTLWSGIGELEHVRAHRVPALVVRDDLLLFFGQRERLAPQAHEHAVAGGVEVFLVHFLHAAAHREQRGFVHEVREVGTAHAGCPAGDHVDADVGRDLLVLEVHLQDLDPLFLRGERDHDLAVEAARAQQRGVEDVGPVRGREHHDALGRLEAVHLGEHLVEGLLAFVVAAAEPGAALAADRVDLVDEDDRGRLLARGLEEVADAGGADADEHLHEVGAGDRDERNAGFTGDRTRDQRLAGARRTDEQHALGDARADVLELAGHLQEVDDFGDLFLHRAVAGDVGEGGLRFVGVVDLGARAPDVHHRAHLALRAPRDEPPERADQRDHEHEAEDRADEVRGLRLVVDVDLRGVELREVGVGNAVGLGRGRERGLAVDRRRALLQDSGDVTARRLVVDALRRGRRLASFMNSE